MKITTLACVAFMFSLLGCASKHPGNEAIVLNKDTPLPFKLSVETIEPKKGKSLQLIEVTLENTSPEWMKLSKVDVVIDNPSVSKLSVVTGKDLTDWAQAMRAQMKLDEYNDQWKYVGIITGGTILTGISTDATVKAIGELMTLGGYAWAIYDSISY